MIDPICSPFLGVPHGFFTRRGGVSSGPYASLNCSLSSADDPGAVARNRARVAEVIGVDVESLVGLTQVHGVAVEVADTAWRPGQGPRADAMVTRKPGLALGIVTADCAPILFADTVTGVVGAAHAGWRGAAAGIIEATVEAMERLGARRQSIAAVVGPCIGQPSYEVGADLRDEVLSQGAEAGRFFGQGRRDDRWQFDLTGYCAHRLRLAAISRIAATGHDTLVLEEQFFSHRRRTLGAGGPIGHQISVIAVA